MDQIDETLNIPERNGFEIAVIGMAGKFPGAKNISEYWKNLCNEVESITFFTDEELVKEGIDEELIKNEKYVKANGILEDSDCFDSRFFDYSPLEAQVMDPQSRILHECVWEALEDSGYNPNLYNGQIGLYLGTASSTYWETYAHLSRSGENLNEFTSAFLANKDFISTNISYKLNLKGPSVVIQSACSTSLVAIHTASRAILTGECDIALAGGATVGYNRRKGYMYEEGMVYSKDGHCRAFDSSATGTVPSDGAGMVVLKSLERALEDGDHIYAILKGSAINNDGNSKVGYTAPSINGQVAVIRSALEMAEVEPESIGYIEAHGTGTALGDVVEIEALKSIFINSEEKCGIGSVKTNVGHLDCASGVAGFIKTVLALYHKKIPASLHFKELNPKIDLSNSPFFINTKLRDWEGLKFPRRAGVSSFGIGGTNAHVVLEEAYSVKSLQSESEYNLIALSAKTEATLDKMTENYIDFLRGNPESRLDDMEYTLLLGRKKFEHRQFTVVSNVNELVDNLSNKNLGKTYSIVSKEEERPIVFMFPGQGVQYINMCRDLYEKKLIFREELENCFSVLNTLGKGYIKDILYPQNNNEEYNKVHDIDVSSILTFIIEYALGKFLIRSGIQPEALIGHSIGEFVCACLSGILTLEDAIRLVMCRGELMKKLPEGIMMSVPLEKLQLIELIGDRHISIAADHGTSCIISGDKESMGEFTTVLKNKRLICQTLFVTRAGHSAAMDSIESEFVKVLEGINFNKQQLPIVSTVTGTWVTNEEMQRATYWAKHMRTTVLFADGIKQILMDMNNPILLEVGPGNVLTRVAMQSKGKGDKPVVFNLLRADMQNISDIKYLYNRLGQIWLYGGKIEWNEFYAQDQEHKRRISLPSYPFEKIKYKAGNLKKDFLLDTFKDDKSTKKKDISDWFYLPNWKTTLLPKPSQEENEKIWVVFNNTLNLNKKFLKYATDKGIEIVEVIEGKFFIKHNAHKYEINPSEKTDFDLLVKNLKNEGILPDRYIFLWGLEAIDTEREVNLNSVKNSQKLGFYSLIYLADVLERANLKEKKKITYVTNNMQKVAGEGLYYPEMATILGPVKIIPKEYSNTLCSSIDISLYNQKEWQIDRIIKQVYDEMTFSEENNLVCYRGNDRMVQSFDQVKIEERETVRPFLKDQGCYVITGGLGGMGLTLCQHISKKTTGSKLILLQRSIFPARKEWEKWLIEKGQDDRISKKILQIQQIEENGGEVQIYSLDVSDEKRVDEVFHNIHRDCGKINGIFHCSGVGDGSLIHNLSTNEVEGVFSSKLYGTVAINKNIALYKPDFYVLCSSFNALLSSVGTTAYTSANCFLDAFSHYKSSTDNIPTLSINWYAWQEIGGAVENVKRLINTAEKSRGIENNKYPHFIKLNEGKDKSLFSSILRAKEHWILNEHRINNKSVLPGTGYLDIISTIMNNHYNSPVFEIKDMYIFKPLYAEDTEEIELNVGLENTGEDRYKFVIKSRPKLAEVQWRVHVAGNLRIGKFVEIKNDKADAIWAKLRSKTNDEETINQAKKNQVQFGPRWRDNIVSIDISSNEGMLLLELPNEFREDLKEYQLHPAMLDVALATDAKGEVFYLPFHYKCIKVYGKLPQKIVSISKYSNVGNAEKGVISYDYNIIDESGNVIIDIEEYTLIDSMSKVKEDKLNQLDLSLEPLEDVKNHQIDDIIKKSLSKGILPHEGIEIFDRLTGGNLSQVVICPVDITEEMNKEKEAADKIEEFMEEENKPVIVNMRPELSTMYVPPQNEVEEKIASIIESILALDKVGIHDNFFDIGATSVSIIQMNRRIQKQFDKEISIVNLYLYTTTHELANFIRNANTTINNDIKPGNSESNVEKPEGNENNKLKLRRRKLGK